MKKLQSKLFWHPNYASGVAEQQGFVAFLLCGNESDISLLCISVNIPTGCSRIYMDSPTA